MCCRSERWSTVFNDITFGLYLEHLAEAVFAGFLPCKFLLFLFPYRKDSALWSPLVRVGSYVSPPWQWTVCICYVEYFCLGNLPLICLISFIYLCSNVMRRLMGIYSVLWSMIHQHLLTAHVFQLWPLLFLLFLWCSPPSLWVFFCFEHFVTFWQYKMFQACLICLLP